MNAATMRTDLQTLERRRSEIAAERDAAKQKLEQAREQLLTGEIKPAKIVEADGHANALTSAVASIDERIEVARSQIKAQAAVEQRADSIARLIEIANSSNELLTQYQQAREETNKVLQEQLGKQMELLAQLLAARQEFLDVGSDLTPLRFSDWMAVGYGSATPEAWAAARALLNELRTAGADLTAVVWQSDGNTTLIDGPCPLTTVDPFESVIGAAFHTLAVTRDQERRAATSR